ncbi:MAG: bifunctional helix-turn-helix transcriptional regulator/GNAT family N-acetyltransferase [Acetobacteraceae bacterium]
MIHPDRIAALRRFNQFYTARIGLLRPGVRSGGLGPTEVQVLFELARVEGTSASQIATSLGLDQGFLSRVLARLRRHSLVVSIPDPGDRRRMLLHLTAAGRTVLAPLDANASALAQTLLGRLPEQAQADLIAAMDRIATLLAPAPSAPVVLHPPEPGDIGWVIARHGALYAAEYGFDARFEALVARVAGDFLTSHDPLREACWIASRDGVNLGSVFLVRADDTLAKLRLLLVEPIARGEGLGRQLVRECLRFARAAGYQRITLWTQESLIAARGIYAAEGFHLVSRRPHDMFGVPQVGEEWERALDAPARLSDAAPASERPPR